MNDRLHISIFCLFAFFFSFSSLFAQRAKQYRVGCLAFYNVENLFDTIDTPGIIDEDFTPRGDLQWNSRLYWEKIDRLAAVVADLCGDYTPDGPALLGLAEIENRSVLEDLARHERIARRRYQIVHYDSPDPRGIDVALLYQPKYFTPLSSRPISFRPFAGGEADSRLTRDILLVSGLFDGDTIHLLVNHWPSRRGGEKATEPLRNAAAQICRDISDSLLLINPAAKIVVMGDFNDDPVSPSIREYLRAREKPDKVGPADFYNPMHELYKKGVGTLAYRDAWSLFDQILLSRAFLHDQGGYRFHQARVFNKPYLAQQGGQFRGYPFRSFAGNEYLGGYSDHFPVYITLVKPIHASAP
jgi:hypothetical protein